MENSTWAFVEDLFSNRTQTNDNNNNNVGPSVLKSYDQLNMTSRETTHMELGSNQAQKLHDEWDMSQKRWTNLNLQLNQVNREKMDLQLQLNKRDEVIRKLEEQVEKRDRILNIGLGTSIGGEENKKEVFLDFSPDGSRIFEIRSKEKIPYWIKTEILSPIIHNNFTDDYDNRAEVIEEEDCVLVASVPILPTANSEQNHSMKTEENEIQMPDKSYEILAESVRTYRREFFSGVTSEKTKATKRSISSSRRQEQEELQSSSTSTSDISNALEKKRRKSRFDPVENYFNRMEEYQNSSSFSTSLDVKPGTSLDNNGVMNIPEIFRQNFATSNNLELDECAIALKFWFQSANIHCTKFFLKLHNDDGDWKRDGKFVLIEQSGLAYPLTHHLKFNEILDILHEAPEKSRIWLDVRDFNCLFSSKRNIFGDSILDSITHFSFGPGLYTNLAIKSHLLLEFIFRSLKNLQYLSVNNQMLRPSDKTQQPGIVRELHSLQTVRFIHDHFQFPLKFQSILLGSCPFLNDIYGLPLHFIRDFEGLKSEICDLDHVQIRSVFIKRDCYNQHDLGATAYLKDLTTLSQLKKWNTLESLDTRTFFLHCSQALLKSCVRMLSNIILRHQLSLTKLKLQPGSSLKIPQMKQVSTLQFFMNRRFSRDGQKKTSFFPRGFDIPFTFPQLSNVEILLEFTNGRFQINPPPVLISMHFPQDIFKANKSFNSVESLKLFGFTVKSCMPRIADLFPNLKILKLNDELCQITQVLPIVYELFPRLHQLHLEINTNTIYGNLDPAFTGMKETLCESLRRDNHSVQEEKVGKAVNNQNGKLTISHLTELRLLKLTLRSSAHLPNVDETLPIITRIGSLALPGFGSKEETAINFKVHVGFEDRVTANEKRRMIASLSSLLKFPDVILEY